MSARMATREGWLAARIDLLADEKELTRRSDDLVEGWTRRKDARYVLCRQNRLFPAERTRGMARCRLGITPDEMDSGHTPALRHPTELADRLEAYAHEPMSARRVPARS